MFSWFSDFDPEIGKMGIPEIGPKIGQKFALDTNKHHHDVQRHLIIKSSYLLYTF